ncbi:MAG: TonB family protein [Chitinophagaceae bacterium]|nr:TonB family protein [Chitinophagaceae bacterium]
MKSILVFFILIVIGQQSVFAQEEKETIFALDENFVGCEYSKSKFIYVRYKEHDSLYKWSLYHVAGALIRTEETKDEDGELTNGITCFYNKNGRIDSLHSYKNGIADGDYYYWNDTGAIAKIVNFKNGVFVKERYNLERSIRTPLPSNLEISGLEVESEYPGGISKWKRYLEKALEYPERALNLKKAGLVKVMFIVDSDGSIKDIRIFQSLEYSLDKQAMQVIQNSKKWTPAYQNGKYVKSYKIQPIIFALSK